MSCRPLDSPAVSAMPKFEKRRADTQVRPYISLAESWPLIADGLFCSLLTAHRSLPLIHPVIRRFFHVVVDVEFFQATDMIIAPIPFLIWLDVWQ